MRVRDVVARYRGGVFSSSGLGATSVLIMVSSKRRKVSPNSRPVTMGAFKRTTSRIDKRFAAIDKRFDAVDRRFEAVDRRFDEVDRRSADMEKRLMAHIAHASEHTLNVMRQEYRQEMARQTEALFERFSDLIRALDDKYRDLPAKLEAHIRDRRAHARS